jgi:hypothetical protein
MNSVSQLVTGFMQMNSNDTPTIYIHILKENSALAFASFLSLSPSP